MFSLKRTKMVYHVPLTKIAGVDLEGLVCASVDVAAQVDELHIINDDEGEGVRGSSTYFEF